MLSGPDDSAPNNESLGAADAVGRAISLLDSATTARLLICPVNWSTH